MNIETFSKTLISLFEKTNKKQVDLAKYLNVSTAIVNDWCKGRKIPRTDKIKRIADFFGVDANYLLNEEVCKDDDMRTVFPIRLLVYMEELGMKQVDLAKKIDVSTSIVSAWCKGQKLPRADKLELVASALGCDMEMLISEEKPVPKYDARHIEIIEIFDSLEDTQKDAVMSMLRALKK